MIDNLHLIFTIYLLLSASGGSLFHEDPIKNFINKPVTYWHLLFYITLPLSTPFMGLLVICFIFIELFCILRDLIIQVHKNSTQTKRHTVRDNIILNNGQLHMKTRPIPEILEELDEAVEERDNND